MIRLYVLVEGQTEEQLVKTLLRPHLLSYGVQVSTLVVETSRDAFGRKRRGGGRWRHWQRDLKRLASQQVGPEVRFTTFFDLYGLPEDFPGLADHGDDVNTVRRAENLCLAMKQALDDYRLIPYLQRHECEALVLASLDALEKLLDAPEDLAGLATLRQQVAGVGPEDINDGRASAPSKRLEQLIPSYRKTLHGPLAVEGTGLQALRVACPRFDAWIRTLEALGERKS